MRCPGWGYCMSNREQTTCVSSVSCTFKQIYVIGTLLHLDWILMDHKIRAHTETHTAAHKHFALLRKLDCLVKIKMQRMCPISSFNTYAINFCSPLNVWKVWVCVCVCMNSEDSAHYGWHIQANECILYRIHIQKALSMRALLSHVFYYYVAAGIPSEICDEAKWW